MACKGKASNDEMKSLRSITHWLWPPSCVLCDERGMGGWDLCRACHDELPRNACCCLRCAAPLPVSTLCGACQKTPPSFDVAHAPFVYDGAIGYLVTGLKFRHRLAYARVLGQLFAQAVPAQSARPECLIPVPLHRKRRAQRGFNQSLEIARIIADQLDLAVEPGLCQRIIDTPHQIGLTAEERRNNLRGAFRATASLARYRHVAVVDDVMTTGSTLEEIARCLKRAGVTTVEAWVCARA